MAQRLTEATLLEAAKGNQEPQLVFKIDGYDRVFGAVLIKKYIRVGDPDLFVDGSWFIGGVRSRENQANYISFQGGTSNTITQQLDQDAGAVSSASAFTVRLIDKHEEITQLITPDLITEDLMGRNARVYLGYKDTAFPEDYIEIHAGRIEDLSAGAGYIDFVVTHPEQKKRQNLFFKVETELAEDISAGATSLTLAPSTDMSKVLAPVLGPDGATYDESIGFYLRIDDEWIKYTGVTGNVISGIERGQHGTAAVEHQSGARVETGIGLEGTAMELALKLMMSGRNGPSVEGLKVSAFVYDIPFVGVLADPRVVQFKELDLARQFGVRRGDFLTVQGAGEEQNNFEKALIEDVFFIEGYGTYLLLGTQEIIKEIDTEATCSIRSQFDCLGHGLAMSGTEVDVDRHMLYFTRYLSSFNYRFLLRDTIEAQNFISKELYRPAACYSIPRSGKCSVGFHAPPLPLDEVKILNDRNIQNPSTLVLKRSLNKNFYNTIEYRFDESPLEDDFLSRVTKEDSASLTRVKVGPKLLEIEARGLRSDLNAANLIQQSNQRRFNRYRFGAEYLENVQLLYGQGFNVEVGDIILLNPKSLKLADTLKGSRDKEPKFWEVQNKQQTLSPGGVTVTLADTNFSTQKRYGLISPSSLVKSGEDERTFSITASFTKQQGENEWRKWTKLAGEVVMLEVRSPDASRRGHAILARIFGNTMELASDLGFVPEAGDLVQLSPYNDQVDLSKLLYTYMKDSDFDDGKPQYAMY